MKPEEQTVDEAMAHLNEVYRLQDQAIADATREVERRFHYVIREAQKEVSEAQKRAYIEAGLRALVVDVNGL